MKTFLALVFLLFTQTATAQLSINDSGIWNEEGRDGHGLIITTWPETPNLSAGANITWFTHTPSGDGQAWLISDNLVEGEDSVRFYMPMGSFPADNYVRGDSVGTFTISKIDENTILLTFLHDLWEVGCLGVGVSPPPPSCFGTIVFNRLTPARN